MALSCDFFIVNAWQQERLSHEQKSVTKRGHCLHMGNLTLQ